MGHTVGPLVMLGKIRQTGETLGLHSRLLHARQIQSKAAS